MSRLSGETVTAETSLDLRGLKCPQPVLRVRRALGRLPAGARLRVDCTDPMAAIDIPNLVRETGDAMLASSATGGVLTFLVRKRSEEKAG